MIGFKMLSVIWSTSFVFAFIVISPVFGGEDTSRVPGPWHTEEHFQWIAGPEMSEEVSMTEETRAFIGSILEAEQMQKTLEVLSASDAWGSLGPNAPAGPGRPDIPRPEKTVRLEIPDDAAGDGTEDEPWDGVLADFLGDYEFEDHGIKTRPSRDPSFADPEELDAYLAALDYEPILVRVPAGHYLEWELTVPPGVWLVGDGEVTISPAVPEGERGTLIEMQIGAGLENVRLDGSNIPGFYYGRGYEFETVPIRKADPDNFPPPRVHAIVAHHGTWVIDSEIRNFTNSGIRAAGTRGRHGSLVTVIGNIIENIGFSGISAQSRWLIQDNQLRHCGYLRSGAGGDDPIIPRHGIETAIINNLVINGRRRSARLGRHVISGQSSDRCLVAGNVSIADGSQRNNIQFSDGSHENRFVGNLAIATQTTNSNIQVGVGANGYANVIEYNVSLLNTQGFRPGGRDIDRAREFDTFPGQIRHNYAETRHSVLIHRFNSSRRQFYNDEGNTHVRRYRSPVLELTDPEEFGFFLSGE